MAHSIFTILTSAAVALHALVGCHFCQDHEHAGDPAASCCQHSAGDGTPDAQIACSDATGGDHHDSPCRGEHEPDCHFVSTARFVEVTFALLPASSMAATVDDSAAGGLILGRQSLAEIPAGARQLPNPLRALTQVWLL